MRSYQINTNNIINNETILSTPVFFVADYKKDIDFHIKADDYFATMATILHLILEEKNKIEDKQNLMIKNIIDNLMYLQENYKIEKKL